MKRYEMRTKEVNEKYNGSAPLELLSLLDNRITHYVVREKDSRTKRRITMARDLVLLLLACTAANTSGTRPVDHSIVRGSELSTCTLRL